MSQATRSRVQSFLGLSVLYMLAIAWAWYAGKDINWDQINYHLYVPELWWHGRLAQDYYAASIQSFLNPLAYIPFFAMVMADWNDLVIAFILATLQFGGVVAIWKLYPRLVSEAFATRKSWRFLACLLGFLSPIYLVELGSSFSESLSGMLVLFALLYILPKQNVSVHCRALFVGGLLMGAATALKLTNGIYPVAVLPLLVWPILSGRGSTLKRWGAFVSGCAVAFVLLQGYFSWQLWQQFSNPFFPFFNGIFKSPNFLPENIQDHMFLGKGVWGLFTLPWDLMEWRSYIYFERVAADMRLLALTLLGMVYVLVFAWKRWHGQPREPVFVPHALILATWFFVISLAVWAWASHIGRYAMPLWLLLGPLLVAWLLRLLPHRQDWAMLLVVVSVVAQSLLNLCVNDRRWTPFNYAGKWYGLMLPDSAKTNNALFLTTQNLSPSFLVPYLPKDASFANIINRQFVVPVGDKIPLKFKRLLNNKKPVFVFMFRGVPEMKTMKVVLTNQNAELAMYGVTFESCQMGAVHFKRGKGDIRYDYALLFCPLERLSEAETQVAVAFADKQDVVFARIEAACPKWFSPSGMQTVTNGHVWWRDYFNVRTRIMVDRQGGVHGSAQGGPSDLYLGSVENILRGASIECPAPVVTRYDK